ncbi:hypothetical protein BZG36_03603 [Bifiguratus adelaidae]|uniref:glutamate--tRNA ligase n=1 Tax=Bifiguratus adelaidae TaxID=1938954 RepID=A0A261XYH3_9FUNG|nr:hypothetical protein BZG36_03603 [Bifiguratus adelaidae]
MAQVLIAAKATPVAYGVATVAYVLGKGDLVQWRETLTLEADGAPGSTAAVLVNGDVLGTVNSVVRFLARQSRNELYGHNALEATLVDQWLDFAQDTLATNDFKLLGATFGELNRFLALRSYLVGYAPTLADFVICGALKGSAIFARNLKTKRDVLGANLVRWYEHISSLPAVNEALASYAAALNAKTPRADQGKFDIPLMDAKPGQVVTRFPPEPSGYLHIGHAKAALLNEYFAKQYNGTMILRFDDTNPTKEKSEFEESIKEDLKLMGVTWDRITHTSDHFDTLYEYALQMLKTGKAYVDDTDQMTMRDQRMHGVASKCRDLSVEENLRRFEEMKKGTEFGQTCCMRAKISVDDPNKAMRDPVIYRCNLTPHHITGDKWKIYPTYDFCCPIVDSIEGVTHALRTNEYRDRNPQYHWMIDALGIRKVNIWDFSRLAFVYTLLSKRKLTWFVNEGIVTGWDDPRFPTVRGIRRRGLTIEALKQYNLMQGASQNTLLLEWDKLWALNKKIIDPVAPRHTSILEDHVKATIVGQTVELHAKDLPKHKKNPELGNKKTTFGPVVLIEQEDAKSFDQDEEITLMDWGNAFVRKINKDASGNVTGLELELHLEGDFKKTKKKITWLADTPDLVPALLFDYDYLITKKKLEEGDDVKDFLTPVSEYKVPAVCDANVRALKAGDIIQLERKGFFIVDKEATIADPIHLIRIPDGKAGSIALKQ